MGALHRLRPRRSTKRYHAVQFLCSPWGGRRHCNSQAFTTTDLPRQAQVGHSFLNRLCVCRYGVPCVHANAACSSWCLAPVDRPEIIVVARSMCVGNVLSLSLSALWTSSFGRFHASYHLRLILDAISDFYKIHE